MNDLRNDPTPMAEPPPPREMALVLTDTVRLAAAIAGPALRLVSVAAILMLVALLYRLGASSDPDAIRLWGTALTGLVALALLELPPRRAGTSAPVLHATSGDALLRSRAVRATDRATIVAARHCASIVTLLAAASLALLFAAVAAGARASVALVACAVVGLLLARTFLWAGERRVVPARHAGPRRA